MESTANPDGSGQQTMRGADLPERPSRLHHDIVAALIIWIICGVVFAFTTSFEEVPPIIAQGMQPAHFPRLIIGIMAFLALLMLKQAWGKKTDRKSYSSTAFLTGIHLVAFVLLIGWVGTIAAMFVFCAVFPILWGERRFVAVAFYAIVFPLVIYFLFSAVLRARLPAGIIESLLK